MLLPQPSSLNIRLPSATLKECVLFVTKLTAHWIIFASSRSKILRAASISFAKLEPSLAINHEIELKLFKDKVAANAVMIEILQAVTANYIALLSEEERKNKRLEKEMEKLMGRSGGCRVDGVGSVRVE